MPGADESRGVQKPEIVKAFEGCAVEALCSHYTLSELMKEPGPDEGTPLRLQVFTGVIPDFNEKAPSGFAGNAFGRDFLKQMMPDVEIPDDHIVESQIHTDASIDLKSARTGGKGLRLDWEVTRLPRAEGKPGCIGYAFTVMPRQDDAKIFQHYTNKTAQPI
jgi:hypothetical protein